MRVRSRAGYFGLAGFVNFWPLDASRRPLRPGSRRNYGILWPAGCRTPLHVFRMRRVGPRVYIPRGTTLRAAAQRERMSSEEVERLKAELAAVKGRAVTKIKQQAQQIVEQQQQLAELRTQLEHVSGATPSNSSDSPSSSGEGDKERFVKVARDGEHSRVRHRGELGRSETGSSKAAPAWHAALLEGLHTIQQSLVAQ